MAPLVASALISAIPALIQGGTGIAQGIRARKMAEGLERPDMKIPQSAIDALERARTMASTFEMPGYSQAVDQINQVLSTTAKRIGSSATSSSEALGAILNASGQAQSMMQNLGAMSAQDYANRQNTLMSQENQMANWEQMLMQDQLNAFGQESGASAALAGAGMQNAFSGASNAAGSVATGLVYNALLNDPSKKKKGSEDSIADLVKMIKEQMDQNSVSFVPSMFTPNSTYGNATPEAMQQMNTLTQSFG